MRKCAGHGLLLCEVREVRAVGEVFCTAKFSPMTLTPDSTANAIGRLLGLMLVTVGAVQIATKIRNVYMIII